MKHIKRLFSTLLVLALALTFAVPAFARSITIKDANEGSTYTAYKLMDVTTTAHTTAEGEAETVYSYKIVEDYRDAIVAGVNAASGEGTVTETTTDEQLIMLISNYSAAQIRTFANTVFDNLPEGVEAPTTTVTDGQAVFDPVDDGYYLLTETVTNANGDVATSLVILDTAAQDRVDPSKGDIEVTAKEPTPEVQKQVKDIADSESGDMTDWQDSADWDIGDGDIIPFKLTAQINGSSEQDYNEYEKYEMVFHDVESAGLTFDPTSVKVYVDGKEVTNTEENTFYTVVTTGLEDGCTFEIQIPDTKAMGAAYTSTITVEYTAKLDSEKAKIGFEGNPNEVYLTFSNNPYTDGKGKTPNDKVTVFTYEAEVKKIDGNGKELAGAAFTLYKYDADAEGDKWVPVGEMAATNDAGTIFSSKGLDDGKYKIVETTVPDGYNKADDLYFTVEAEHTDGAEPALTSVTFRGYTDEACETAAKDADGNDIVQSGTSGKFSVSIVNLTGARLPSTGGMGTTLFYIVGGILVAAAVILLVTKKRVNSDK